MTKCKLPILLLCISCTYVHARELSVQVREAPLRSAPSFLSRVQMSLPYTSRVTVLTEQGDWLKVQPAETDVSGWIHQSALTKKKLALTAGEKEATTSVTTDEQALAGKGFNAQVEAEFQKQNEAAAFAWVDKMEKLVIPLSKIQAFLEKGNLGAYAEGGAQ